MGSGCGFFFNQGKEFGVAGGAEEGRGRFLTPLKTGERADESAEFSENTGMDSRIEDDAAAAAGFRASGFELGFDEGDEVSAGTHQGGDGAQEAAEGNEGTVENGEIEELERRREMGGGKGAGIDAFKGQNTGVLTEFPGELALADIDGGDGRSAVLEEAIGEAAGGSADVEGTQVPDLKMEGGEGVFQFMSATAHVTVGGGEIELVIGSDGAAGFVSSVSIESDLPGEDGALRFFSGFAEAAGDQGLIEAHVEIERKMGTGISSIRCGKRSSNPGRRFNC
jgi:hypothetical protein